MNRTKLKPIETCYDGYKFRSRLEARWAVFFNALDIKYEYEPEGYDLGNGLYYLPDFWLPEQDCWVEVKGAAPTPKEFAKALKLTILSGKPVFIAEGPIPSFSLKAPKLYNIWGLTSSGYGRTFAWTVCGLCHKVGITECGSDGLLCNCENYDGFGAFADEKYCGQGLYACSECVCSDKGKCHYDPAYHPFLSKAYTAARQARFERW